MKQSALCRCTNICYNELMNMPLKLTSFGNSVGAIFPKDVLARLKADKGDVLYLTEAPDGSYRLSPYDPEFEEQMKHAERIMNDDRDILRVLAK
tara:strand:+ start:37222 stop:37503 length:282 start_codon:yes stop_codon:yes gene_type:complete